MDVRTAAILVGVWCLSSMAAGQTLQPDAERMERTKREASNPLRFIIESSQIKRSGKPADTPPAPAAPPSRAQPERRAAAVPLVEAPSAPPASAPPAAATETALAVAAPPVAPAPPVAVPDDVTATPDPARLQLLSTVDPDVPARVRIKLKKSSEVTVDLTVGTDGSVTDVAVHQTSNTLLNDPVLAAVRQWRFAPLPEAREHRIVVVYKVDD